MGEGGKKNVEEKVIREGEIWGVSIFGGREKIMKGKVNRVGEKKEKLGRRRGKNERKSK